MPPSDPWFEPLRFASWLFHRDLDLGDLWNFLAPDDDDDDDETASLTDDDDDQSWITQDFSDVEDDRSENTAPSPQILAMEDAPNDEQTELV